MCGLNVLLNVSYVWRLSRLLFDGRETSSTRHLLYFLEVLSFSRLFRNRVENFDSCGMPGPSIYESPSTITRYVLSSVGTVLDCTIFNSLLSCSLMATRTWSSFEKGATFSSVRMRSSPN